MELYYSPTSPYARKARAVIIEKGLEASVKTTAVIPYENPPKLLRANPLCKVPALVLENGDALFDSPVICAYLDGQGEGPKLIPDDQDRLWPVMKQQALADGMLDATYLTVMETKRDPSQRSKDWTDRLQDAIIRTLDIAETDYSLPSQNPDLGQLTLAIALEYLDLRMDELNWRQGRAKLTAWHEQLTNRESLLKTRPQE